MADEMDRLQDLMRRLAALVNEFETLAPGRKFTADGHMVGSIGELIAKTEFGLELSTASNMGYDAIRHTSEGQTRTVEIKATQRGSVSLRHAQPLCDELIVLQLDLHQGTWRTAYNGPARPVSSALAPGMPSNGQRAISLNMLEEIGLPTELG